MTRRKRSIANLERKVTDLYIKATSRKTKKLSRKFNLMRRFMFFKDLLNKEIQAQNDISVLNKEATQTASKETVELLGQVMDAQEATRAE